MSFLFYIIIIIITSFHYAFTKKFNIILFLTDDQDLLLNSMIPLQKTIKLLANEGLTFQNAFVNAPICCPSRSVLLTGRLPHNVGVRNNSLQGGCSGKEWREKLEPETIAPLLKQAGYNTFYSGKYLNQYGNKKAGGISHVPVGWDWWFGLVGNSKYYNYTLSINGTRHRYIDSYLTDLISEKALHFLDNVKVLNQPFFMVLSTSAPHAPFTPAPRHKNAFPTAKALRTPSFNVSALNKHWLLRMSPKYLPLDVSILDEIQAKRLKTLLSVDEMVATVVNKVDEIGKIDDTYFIYTSDNGFHIGQFSQPWDKRQPYETDIRIPFIIRGPGIQKRSLSKIPIQLADLAPTLLDMARIPIPSTMDGQSIFNLVNENISERNILIEYHGEGNAKTNDKHCWSNNNDLAECTLENWCKCQDSVNNTYNCVRRITINTNFIFCEFLDTENFKEAYDLSQDPYQLENIFGSMSDDDISFYRNLIKNFLKCKGSKCRL